MTQKTPHSAKKPHSSQHESISLAVSMVQKQIKKLHQSKALDVFLGTQKKASQIAVGAHLSQEPCADPTESATIETQQVRLSSLFTD